MPVVLWACPLIVYREASLPAVVRVLDTVGPHTTSWSTTPGHRSAPYAVGCSSVLVEQLTALEAEPTIHVWDEAAWQQQFDTLPIGIRTRLNQFCTTVGIARPMANEVVRDILTRMSQLIDNKVMEEHVLQVQRRQGG